MMRLPSDLRFLKWITVAGPLLFLALLALGRQSLLVLQLPPPLELLVLLFALGVGTYLFAEWVFGLITQLQEQAEHALTAAPATTVPEVAAGDAEAGQALYSTNCSACHGPGGQGIQGLGKDFTMSDFIASQSDAQLLEFIKVGRLPTDPANTTGVAMPPKGGNPALTDEQILDIIAWIRSIHQ